MFVMPNEHCSAPFDFASVKLHGAGLIHHSRGSIKVLDRAGLEAHECECYGIVKREFGRMVPRVPQTEEVC